MTHSFISKWMIDQRDFREDKIKHLHGGSDTPSIVTQISTGRKCVRKLIGEKLKDDALNDFYKNIQMLATFQFPSIVPFIGYFINNNNFGYILTEKMEYGSLDMFIKQNSIKKSNGIDNTRKLIISYGIAAAIEFLHKSNVVHGCINLSNVLLNSKLEPNILLKKKANDLYIEELVKQSDFPVIYIPPEILDGTYLLTNCFDTYSYGMTLYYLITETLPFISEPIFAFLGKVISGHRPEIPKFVPDCWRDLITSCWDQEPSNRPSFTEICDILESPMFNNDSIDKEVFSEYMERIKPKRPNILSKSDEQKFSQNEQIECSVCLKKFNDKKEVICVEDGVFMCSEDFDRFDRQNELPQKFVDDYCDRIIEETFSLFVSRTSIDSCRKEDIFVDSETLSDSFHLNEDFKYFCPTVTFHFEQSPSEINFKKIIRILPNSMSVTHIRKGSTFIVIAFIASEAAQTTEESCRKMIEEIKEKLSPPMKEPLVGNYGEPTFEVPSDNDIKEFFQKKSVNIFQSPEILELINVGRVKEKVNEKLKKQKIDDKNLAFLFEHFDMFESSEEQVRKDIEKSKYEFIITGETVIANKFIDVYEEIKDIIREEGSESSECFLYHGSQLKNHFGIVSKHFHEPEIDNNIDGPVDPGYYGIGIYATDDIFYASMYSNNRRVLKFNGMASVICCRAVYNKMHVLELKPTRKGCQGAFFGKEMDPEVVNGFGIHKVLVGSNTRFYPIYEKDIEKNLIAAYEYVFPDRGQIIPISSFTIKRTDHFMIWIDDGVEDNHEILDEIRKAVEVNIYVKSSVSECTELVKKKKKNAVKIIVSVSEKEKRDKIINEVNNIKGINCIFMIYSKDRSLAELSSNRKNVLYADHSSHIIRFAKCGMKINLIKELAKELKKQYNIQMDIDLNEVSDERDPLKELIYPDA